MSRNKANIKVYLTDVGPPPGLTPTFNLHSNLPSSGGGPHPIFQFKNGGNRGFEITFDLYDQTNNGMGSGYQFAMDERDAVWSQLGTVCPTTRVSQVFSEITRMSDTNLVVVNENPDTGNGNGQGDFTYTLNVSLDGDLPYVHIDPGGQNQDGPISKFSLTAVLVTIVVLAAIAIFALYELHVFQ